MPHSGLAVLTGLLWLITAAVMDLRIRKVRNWMVLLGLVMGLAAIMVGVQPFQISIWNGLSGMLVAFAALLPFYALRWMGAGDVKFAAVMGLWFGLSSNLLLIWVVGSWLACAHGVLVLLWRRLLWSPFTSWIQAHLPLRVAAVIEVPANQHISQPDGRQRIQRSIPYAGYMALMAIWLLLSVGR